MKKLLLIGIALFTAVVLVTPAVASELQLGGYFRVEGDYDSDPQLNDDQNAGGARWRMRFRFLPAIIVSDALRFDFKADIFDGTTWGTYKSSGSKASTAKENAGTYVDVDRAWMTVSTSFGKFAAGRMPGGAWGLTFGDDNEDYDRARFDTKFGNLTTGVILQKNVEGDWGNANQVDQDTDTYYLYGVYKADFGAVGLLGAYVNGKSITTVDYSKYALDPYFDVKFGNLGLRGELYWATGELDPDAAGAATTDVDELMYNIEADYTFGAFTVTGGYAWVQGEDADPLDRTETNATYGGIGDDWDLLLILMDQEAFINGGAYQTFPAGVKLWYGQVEYKLSKEWKFWATVGGATAESTDSYAPGTDDNMGIEYDLNAQWNVMKNLKFLLRAGYLSAGDFWKHATPGDFSAAGYQRNIQNLDDNMSVYQQWTLSF